jgi:toxin ParE1/3/4
VNSLLKQKHMVMQKKLHKLILTPRAKRQLGIIFIYLNQKAGVSVASNYIIQIENRLEKLKLFPFIGSLNDDIIPNLRIIGFKKRVMIAFTVSDNVIIVHSILYGGQNISKALSP